MRLGYLGPEGTFSEEAVRTAPEAADATLVALPTVHDTVMAVHDGDVERAVVPIENSLEGPVGVTLDTLADDGTDVEIVGEVVVAVSPCLIARDGTALEQIERVVSHPQPLSQCARFLRERLPHATVAAAESTAEAVRMVAAETRPWAALGTRRAAELYGARSSSRGSRTSPATRRASSGSPAGPRPWTRPSRVRRRSRSGAPATTARAGSCAACRSSPSAA